MPFSDDSLAIDVDHEIDVISRSIAEVVHRTLRRKGAVVAVSGGIDSAACAALCARALGSSHALLLGLPEAASSPLSTSLAQDLAAALGAEMIVDDITPALEGVRCYERQVEAIRQVFPDYGDGWKHKLTIPSILDGDRLNVTRLTVENPAGEQQTARLPAGAYLQMVAATNFKQRTRTSVTYYHADRLHYAVCGTPNRLEYDQGFFVKGGDGLADFKPIAHLYKSQVYAVAAALGVPDEILRRTPTTDTFSLEQTQEEFYFALPYQQMDLCLYAHNHGVSAAETAPVVGLTEQQVVRVFHDIDAKRRATASLHLHGLLVAPVPEIG
ncbi:MAG: NAD(+) synthase [Ilumatobacteraceae bacterium]